jgi:pyridoxal phosphate enzyme (YggS family)
MHHEGTKERSEVQGGSTPDRPLLLPDGSRLAERIEKVQARIRAAALRAGRDPAEVTMIAVSKTQAPETVAAAYRAGLKLFGENRIEEAAPKARAVADLLAPDPPPSWHMVGHLQSRKAAEALPWAAMIHSVESEKLARRLSRFCVEHVREMPVLIEVNVSGEDSKYGVLPAALADLVNTVAGLPGLRLEGLMTVAPIAADPEAVRPVFAGLRALRDDLAERCPDWDLHHLSMGMTDDFEVAIEEGATLIRIGRAIFGERNG